MDKQFCTGAAVLQLCILHCSVHIIETFDDSSSKPACEQFVWLEVLIHFPVHICPVS